ncbi:hypothetical protein OC845_006040 [Tilletia horrida]|nr:hypothetical protein OC845_006040 [Tilletia horrida]
MSSQSSTTEFPFGSLLCAPPDHRSSQHDHASTRVLGWYIMKSKRTLRLYLAYQGAFFKFSLAVEDAATTTGSVEAEPSSFCRSIWNAVEPTFLAAEPEGPVQRGRPEWRGCEAGMTPEAIQQEDLLLATIRADLPRLVGEVLAARPGPISGSYIWVTIKDDPEHPEQPVLSLLGDHFRTIALPYLQNIGPTEYPGVPRVDLSAIHTFLSIPSDPVCEVLITLSTDAEPERLIFKTARLNTWFLEGMEASRQSEPEADEPGKDGHKTESDSRSAGAASDDESEDGPEDDEIFYQRSSKAELAEIMRLQSHPNIIPAPAAIVTVSDPNQPEAPPKLVGWLQTPFLSWSGKEVPGISNGTEESARWRMKYGLDLCLGLQHMIRARQSFHTDLGLHNILLSGPPPKSRLMLMDFEYWNRWVGTDGLDAPEVDGWWDPVVSSDGKLSYVRRETQVEHEWDRIRFWTSDEALERLYMISTAAILGHILDCRMVCSWATEKTTQQGGCLFSREIPRPGQDIARDKWEALIPKDIRAAIQQCLLKDPLLRPNIDEMVSVLQTHAVLPAL